jgi:pantetheine-phosphate adenylyltransferase
MNDKLSSHHAVYVGSFDPLTLGHVDIIRRGAAIFDRLTVGIGINPEKRPLFSPDERVQLTAQSIKSFTNVDVLCFHGLTVDFIRQCGARVLVRGVRTLSDIEAEFTMTLANRALDPEIDTVFLMASEKYTHISSSLIKQIAQLGQNAEKLSEFVPPQVIQPLLAKYKTADPATSG